MSDAAAAEVQLAGILRRRPTRLQGLITFFRTKPLGAAGGSIIVFMILVAFSAPLIAPYGQYEIRMEQMFTPPCREFILGTDNFGRDVLSRIIFGSQISLWVGIMSVLIGTTSGAIWGLVSGYFGGRIDLISQRALDILMSFPTLVLGLMVVAALGPGLNNVIIAIGVSLVAYGARTVRSAVLSVKETQYIEAARAIGCSHLHILLRHAAPNCTAPYIIMATVALGSAIITEASLSFLGLGVPPPVPSWGGMLSGGAQMYLEKAPWMAVFPGVALSIAVFGWNLLGDAIRDVWDPRLRKA